jgi:hypothetical protein
VEELDRTALRVTSLLFTISMNTKSIRERILAADDIKKERGVHVPEWDVTVDVWGLSGEERARALKGGTVDGEMDDALVAVAMVIESVRDPASGERVFGEADRDALHKKASTPVARLARIALSISGLSKEALDGIRGNSSATPSGGSTSASPRRSGARSRSSSGASAPTS